MLPRAVHVPLAVGIAADLVEPVVERGAGWRGRQPGTVGIQLGHDVPQRRQHRRARLVQRPVVGQLVAAAPEQQRWMVPPERDDGPRLGRHQVDERGVGGGHALGARARLTQLLPDEDARAIARVVERLVLDQATAPHAQYVHVRFAREADEVLEMGRARDPVEDVERRPVPARDRPPATVDLERVATRAGGGSLVRDEARGAEADRDDPAVEHRILGAQELDGQPMDDRLASPVHPPWPRRRDVHRDLDLAGRGRRRRGSHGALPIAQGQREPATDRDRIDRQPHREAGVSARRVDPRRPSPHVDEPPRSPGLQRHGPPDPLVDQSRAEVPAVRHPALVDPNAARAPHLRLGLGRRRHDDVQALGTGRWQRHLERHEHPLVLRDDLTIQEHRRRVVDAREPEPRRLASGERRHGDRAPVPPRPLRDPLEGQAVPLVVGRGRLARLPHVVGDRARHPGREPAVAIPGMRGRLDGGIGRQVALHAPAIGQRDAAARHARVSPSSPWSRCPR